MKGFLVLLFLLFQSTIVYALDTLSVNEGDAKFIAHNYYSILNDPDGTFQIKDVAKSTKFHYTDQSLPFINYSTKVIWLKLILKNNTTQPFVPISITSSVIDNFDLYFKYPNSEEFVHLDSNSPHSHLNQFEQNLIHINCIIYPDSSRIVYLRIKSAVNTVIPIQAYSANEFLQSASMQNIAMGGFMGVIIIMAIYNLLLLFIVKDISYLYYVLYIIFLGLNQMLLKGYGLNFITHDKIIINNIILPITRVLFGYSILMFVYEFLQIKSTGKALNWFYAFLFLLYTSALVAVIFGRTHLAYNIISISALTISISLISIGIALYLKGFKPAKYFMFGWTFFFLSIIFSVARNQGLINYNTFTGNIILYGSAVELILFSAALADKINFYRRQKNESQMASLTISTRE